jgi:peptidoglycan/xylan/chitin deacetylase (PgdA/CDA1 family)
MNLRSQLGDIRRRVLSAVYKRPLVVKNQPPIVSFCFDDFPRTAYTVGGSILKAYEAKGTYYAALGLMNTTNELGDQMTTADIDSLLSDGHELGSHTFSHSSSRRLSLADFEADVLRGQEAIRTLTGMAAGHFAYPFGHVTLAAKKRLGPKLSSSRSIFGGVNTPAADLNLLKANSLYGDIDQSSHAGSLIAEAERTCGWLIFYTHDVRQNPSPFGCTPALLDKVLTLATQRGLAIKPVGEVVGSPSRKANASFASAV